MSASSSSKHNRSGLWLITKGHRSRYLVAVFMATLANVFMLGGPIIAKYGIDVVTLADFSQAEPNLLAISHWIVGSNSFAAYLILSGLAGVLITTMASLCQFTRDRLSAVVSERIALSLRETLFDRLHHAPANFFDSAETGDLVQRCSSDVETVRVFMHSDVDEVGRTILFLIVMLPVLLWHNVTLTWVSMLLMPILLFGAIWFFYRITHLFQITDEAEGALTAVLQENITGIRVVQAFARQEFEENRLGKKNAAFRDNYYRLNRSMSVYWGLSDFVAMIQSGLVLIVGAYLISQNRLTFGELFMFVSLVGIVIWRIRHLGRTVFDAGKAVVSIRRIDHILTTDVESRGAIPEIVRTRGDIVFENVVLNYESGKSILRDISLKIKAGETIGIVGAPGSGKSTLVLALLQLYALSSGRILIDGLDISTLDRKWLRRQIGVVLQDPFLFSKTIEDNLRLGRQDANETEIHGASAEAAIHQSILGFGGGYKSLIGERGVTLSGGQRQRIALARALLKNPPILILDDALSAVDTNTERHILNALENRRGKHTTFVIAHRLTSVRATDRILVIEDGRIAQMGTHNDLMNQPGFYHELCEFQRLMDESIEIEVEEATHG